jgi:hypothetical protein
MVRTLSCLLCLLLWIPGFVRADEPVRQVQEELRKRNLYFGNIDGQTSEFTMAFELRSPARTSKSRVLGRTKNWWNIQGRGPA